MLYIRRTVFFWMMFLLPVAVLPGSEGTTTEFPVATPESQGLSSEALDALADLVQGYVEGDQIVGAELLVIKNRRNVLHRAFGMRDREENKPWEINTICNIRSMTKPITGAGIQILVDEGKLELSDRAADFLPGFENDACKKITIEQLLTHRSGLPLSIMLDVASMDLYKTLIEMANAAGEKGPEFDPGSKFWYSDTGTDVLGAITEVVSETALDEFRKKRLLDPLGMKDTLTLCKGKEFPRERVASLYFGGMGSWNRFWKSDDDPFYPYAWGSQTLYSTPMDYARFLAMWLDEGKVGGKAVLSKNAVARMLTPAAIMTSLGSDGPFPTGFPGYKVYYGQMAVLYTDTKAEDPKKPVVIGHSGSDGTFAWAWPGHDLMVLYFTQSRGQATGIRLEKDIYKLLINPDFKEDPSQIPDALKPFIGHYTANFGPYNDVKFEVLVQNENLAVDIPGKMIFELNEPDENGCRAFKMTGAVAVKFVRNDSGKVDEMQLIERSSLPRKSAFEDEEMDMPDEVRPLLGTYTVPMANDVVTIRFKRNALNAEIPGMGSMNLKKKDDGKGWVLKKNEGFEIHFDFDDSGEVTAMRINQIHILPRDA